MIRLALPATLALAACTGGSNAEPAASAPFVVTPVARFDEPWAMTFLPDGKLLVTEKPGRLWLLSADGKLRKSVFGVPKVAYAGQGGLADVVRHPDFKNNGFLYLVSVHKR
jgi:glucose/arabinose dehydrogenase